MMEGLRLPIANNRKAQASRWLSTPEFRIWISRIWRRNPAFFGGNAQIGGIFDACN